MKHQLTIRQFFSLALIVLFAGSIVPKKVWHDAFACHQVTSFEKEISGLAQIKPHKYNCTGHQADVQCPYLPGESISPIRHLPFSPPISSFSKPIAWHKCVVTYGLRGPPSLS